MSNQVWKDPRAGLTLSHPCLLGPAQNRAMTMTDELKECIGCALWGLTQVGCLVRGLGDPAAWRRWEGQDRSGLREQALVKVV